MSVQDKVRAFIVEQVGWEGAPPELTGDFPLLEKRVLDSMGLFQLVAFIEKTYDLEIEDDELVGDHFGTLDRIADFVESKGKS